MDRLSNAEEWVEPSQTGCRLDSLVERIYHELRHIAHFHRNAERADLTLQTTALVHEAYIRLAERGTGADIQDGKHLKALTSRVVRHVLVDYARRARAQKRDPQSVPEELLEQWVIEPGLDLNVLDLDAALHRLSRDAPRMERVVECRFFGGMNVQETAEALDLSPRTVEREWRRAKAYLLRRLDTPIAAGEGAGVG